MGSISIGDENGWLPPDLTLVVLAALPHVWCFSRKTRCKGMSCRKPWSTQKEHTRITAAWPFHVRIGSSELYAWRKLRIRSKNWEFEIHAHSMRPASLSLLFPFRKKKAFCLEHGDFTHTRCLIWIFLHLISNRTLIYVLFYFWSHQRLSGWSWNCTPWFQGFAAVRAHTCFIFMSAGIILYGKKIATGAHCILNC